MNGNQFLKEHCTVLEHPDSNVDVYCLHWYMGSKESCGMMTNHYNTKGYTTIACDARGHGERYGTSNFLDWGGTVEELDTLITKRNRSSILIGTSMGGSQAITIGLKNPLVKQVFAISALHDGKDVAREDIVLSETIQRPSVLDGLPSTVHETPRKNEFFLIHGTNDSVAPMKHFYENKKALRVSDDHALVLDLPPLYPIAHGMPSLHTKTFEFIDANIMKPK